MKRLARSSRCVTALSAACLSMAPSVGLSSLASLTLFTLACPFTYSRVPASSIMSTEASVMVALVRSAVRTVVTA